MGIGCIGKSKAIANTQIQFAATYPAQNISRPLQ
jgi:hypothetical protein